MNKKEFDEKLIMEVESHPVIYNKQSKDYKNRCKKEDTWVAIGYALGQEVSLCKARWKNLRDQFSAAFKQTNIPSGSKAPKKACNWAYFEILQFLVPFIEVPSTRDSHNTENITSQTTGTINLDFDATFSEDIDNCDSNNNSLLTTQPVPSQREPHSRTPQPRLKRQKIHFSDTIEERLDSLIDRPDSPPIDQFFSSMAARAATFNRSQQIQLEKKCLEAIHAVENGTENDIEPFFINLSRRAVLLSKDKKKQIKRVCSEAMFDIEIDTDDES